MWQVSYLIHPTELNPTVRRRGRSYLCDAVSRLEPPTHSTASERPSHSPKWSYFDKKIFENFWKNPLKNKISFKCCFRLWLNTAGNRATGNILKDALTTCGRQDIIDSCALELAEVTDRDELSRAENQLGKVLWIKLYLGQSEILDKKS